MLGDPSAHLGVKGEGGPRICRPLPSHGLHEIDQSCVDRVLRTKLLPGMLPAARCRRCNAGCDEALSLLVQATITHVSTRMATGLRY